MKQSGYWALKVIQPPHVSGAHLLMKRTADQEDVELEEEGNRAAEAKDKDHLGVTNEPREIVQIKTEPSTEEALEIKRRLVERLLKVDQTILQAALKRTEAVAGEEGLGTISGNKPLAPKGVIQLLTPNTFAKPMGTSNSKLTASTVKKVGNGPSSIGQANVPLVRRDRRPKPANYVRASPHENELLETCNKIAQPDGNVSRFRRKLLARKAKRLNGLPILDLDALIYQYLKHADPIQPLAETIPLSLLEQQLAGEATTSAAMPDLTAAELAEVTTRCP